MFPPLYWRWSYGESWWCWGRSTADNVLRIHSHCGQRSRRYENNLLTKVSQSRTHRINTFFGIFSDSPGIRTKAKRRSVTTTSDDSDCSRLKIRSKSEVVRIYRVIYLEIFVSCIPLFVSRHEFTFAIIILTDQSPWVCPRIGTRENFGRNRCIRRALFSYQMDWIWGSRFGTCSGG